MPASLPGSLVLFLFLLFVVFVVCLFVVGVFVLRCLLFVVDAIGPVAQWIRHRPTEPGIAGSSPAGVIDIGCSMAGTPRGGRLTV